MRVWMLGLLAVVLAIVVIRIVIRHNQRYSQNTTVRFPLVTIVVLVSTIALVGWSEWRWLEMQRLPTAAMQELIEREDAEMVCQRFSDALIFTGVEGGHVEWEPGDSRETGRTAWLSLDNCSALGTWLRSDKQRANHDEIVAIHVLAHEAVHVAGHRGEAETECLAMRLFPVLAHELGAEEAEAARMARYYEQLVWPEQRAEYIADCGDFEDEPIVPR
jgi:ABC-type nickel/cobalt efflux system permease component RcnA